ncbi:MAG: UDP-3-O-acyl-N-acetylglucosamine deacetylase [Bdellovibrionaceae bacterium]|nr:UDP-3-O-acyl-N-acetylglucosamine deacetylase [Pseudobdellovibrionaceae bacterium]
MFLQNTLKSKTSLSGVGLHSGKEVSVNFLPATVDTGICFVRADLPKRPCVRLEAHKVKSTELATTLDFGDYKISTVEHCLAALYAMGVDNLYIEVFGEEMPILDGSSKVFVQAFKKAEVLEQNKVKPYVCVQKEFTEKLGSSYAKVEPYNGLRISCNIDFPHPKILKQSLDLEIDSHSFDTEIAGARTFGFIEQVEQLKKQGLVLGGSLDNAIVLTPTGILNQEGLRFSDEFVRHKILDALGDLAILGRPLLAQITLYKPGHALMNQLLQRLLALPAFYDIKERAGALKF